MVIMLLQKEWDEQACLFGGSTDQPLFKAVVLYITGGANHQQNSQYADARESFNEQCVDFFFQGRKFHKRPFQGKANQIAATLPLSGANDNAPCSVMIKRNVGHQVNPA